jgi:hypothetical protein
MPYTDWRTALKLRCLLVACRLLDKKLIEREGKIYLACEKSRRSANILRRWLPEPLRQRPLQLIDSLPRNC